MGTILPTSRLKRIAQAKRDTVLMWMEGVSLERDANKNIGQLLCQVATDRWKLANVLRGQANKLFAAKPPHFRSAVSRYYYCMYHALRACVFLDYQGDDHEEHSTLPLNIPKSFDARTNWQTKLKDARLLRNRADYEAYPKSEIAWRKHALTMKPDAERLIHVSRAFLRSKGCNL